MLWVLACSGGGGATDSGEHASKPVAFIQVTPAEVTMVSGPTFTAPAEDFTATVTYETGETVEVDWVEWSVSNWSSGEIDESGLFTASTVNGGRTWINALLAGVEGQATVTVVYTDSIFVQDVDDALFDGEAAEPDADPWLYPEDGVNVPRNTPSLRFQWEDTADAYQLRFQSGVTDISVYTVHNYWEADTETWPLIAGTNAGGSVEVTLAGAGEDGSLWRTAEPRSLTVNRLDAQGSIIYWTTSEEGLKEIVYGEEADNFLTRWETDGHCIGCHVISSQNVLAFTYDGGDQEMGVVAMGGEDEDDDELYGLGDGIYGNFKAFSPDGKYLLASYQGALLLYDGVTGDYLNEVSIGDVGEVIHVDWSPDGEQIVVSVAEYENLSAHFEQGWLMVAEHHGDGSFGEATLLFDPDEEGRNAYYPAFSPDSGWIAFNQSYGDAYDDYDAELFVISREGGDPIRLDAANMSADDDLSNSWPKWGPLPDDDILWLAFASRRPYGEVTNGEQPQIWLSAFDPSKAEAGEDPSWPAFWLPSQESEENNHLPVWVD